jgi:CheY-like chemotaxis protein
MLAYSGKGRYIIDLVNLSEIIIEMDQLMKVGISKKINLRLMLDFQLPFISADETQIKQIVMNLVLNANEAFQNREGEITVITGKTYCDEKYLADTYLNDDLPAGEYVFIEVSDQGGGMDEDTIKKMFDPFFSTKFIGRGLGLATVLGIVRAHKGAIEIHSELHVGSRVRILFPVAEEGVKPIRKHANKRAKSYKGWFILFVDDEELVRKVANKMLTRRGFEVINAEDGPSAIEIYKKNMSKINLVVIDYTMPGMDGLETYHELKKINKDVKVIIVSGYDEKDEVKKLEDTNLIGFIQKPFRVSELLEKINDMKLYRA